MDLLLEIIRQLDLTEASLAQIVIEINLESTSNADPAERRLSGTWRTR